MILILSMTRILSVFVSRFFRLKPVEQEHQSALAEAAAKMLHSGVFGAAGGADTRWWKSWCHTRGAVDTGQQRSLAGRKESSGWELAEETAAN